MTTEQPWSQIAPGRARRVDADHVADFYWSVAPDGEPQLVLEFPSSATTPHLPKLRGMVVRLAPMGDGRSRLILLLADASLRDIFWSLCQDIVSASRIATDDESAAQIAIRRTWRWHHLLRGGTSGLLTPEEQKGLIGEIHVLMRLLRLLGAADAVASWRGPLGAPKDFEIGPHAVEAKARRGAATPRVSISSEDQLDTEGVENLLLHVVDLSAAAQGEGFTLTEAAHQMTETLRHEDEGLLEPLEDRLASAGFAWADDYSEFRWSEGQHRLYHVIDSFPRIEASTIHTGVSRVRYEVDLNAINEFEIDWPSATRLLMERAGSQ